MTQDQKLEICKRTRILASKTLLTSLKKLLKAKKPISEILLRDTWISELRKNKNIFPDGWYTPPPHGMIILFADDKNVERINYKSARPKEKWPRDDIFLNRENGLIFIYASPVDKETGIIGDFGVTLYFGKNNLIKEQLLRTYKINYEIFNKIEIGLPINEYSEIQHKILKRNGLISNLLSPTDPTGTNTGHTIPLIDEDPKPNELNMFKSKNLTWKKISDLISKKREFINTSEEFKIHHGTAFTIEPRTESLNGNTTPMILFHMISLIKTDGEKELLTNFDELFKFIGMDYMI